MKKIGCLFLGVVLIFSSAGNIMATTVETQSEMQAVNAAADENAEGKEAKKSDEVLSTEKVSDTETSTGTEELSTVDELGEADNQIEESQQENVISEVPENVLKEETVQENEFEDELPGEESVSEQPVDEELFSVWVGDGTVKEYVSEDGIHYLFLQDTVDLSNLTIQYTGTVKTVDKGTLNEELKTISGSYADNDVVEVTMTDDTVEKVKLMQSSLPSMNITLAQELTLGHIDGGSKDEKYPGNHVEITDAGNPENNITADGVEIKGRGNTSWSLEKKSYQIKFDSKTSLFGMEKAKKWLLIADHTDPAFLRNTITNDLASSIGMAYVPGEQYVNLWVDGDYRGMYRVSEKAENGTGRIELSDDNAVVVELDNGFYNEEEYWFCSDVTQFHFVFKEFENEDNIESSIETFKTQLNTFEKLLYAEKKDWDAISKTIDVESFAQYYMIYEFALNGEALQSSFYMYQDGANDVIHLGPVWDYDSAYGYDTRFSDTSKDMAEFGYEWQISWFKELMKIPEFADRVDELYTDQYKAAFRSVLDTWEPLVSSRIDCVDMNFARWDILGKENPKFQETSIKTFDTYQENADYVKQFVEARYAYFTERYQKGRTFTTKLNQMTVSESSGSAKSVRVDYTSTDTAIQFRLNCYDNDTGNLVSQTDWQHEEEFDWTPENTGNYRLEIEAKTRDGITKTISTEYEQKGGISITGLYVPNDEMTVGSTMDEYGNAAAEEIPGTYGKTVDVGVVLENPWNVPIKRYEYWYRRIDQTGTQALSDWSVHTKLGTEERASWDTFEVPEKGYYQVVVRAFYKDGNTGEQYAEYTMNWYCGGVYFTFIKTGSNGIWSPSGINLRTGTNDFQAGVMFGSNAEDLQLSIHAAECTFDQGGLPVQKGAWELLKAGPLDVADVSGWGNWFTFKPDNRNGHEFIIYATWTDETGKKQTDQFLWWTYYFL